MRTRTITTTIAAGLLLATLTSCSGEKPAPVETVTATATPRLSKAEITAQCVDAVAKVIDARPDTFDPDTDQDPKPEECNSLSDSEYLDAYMDGLSQRNRDAIDEMQRKIDEASKAAEQP